MAEDIDYVILRPRKFLDDFRDLGWNVEQFGLYCFLCFFLYERGGKIHFNLENLERQSNDPNFEQNWGAIKNKFRKLKGGYVTHKTVVKELQKARVRAQVNKDKGLKGAKVRWHKDSPSNSPTMPKAMLGDGHETKTKTKTKVYNPPTPLFNLQQVKDIGIVQGVPEDKATEFFHHYNAQGWVRANSQKIVDLHSMLAWWKANQYKFEKPGSKKTEWICSKCKKPTNSKDSYGRCPDCTE